MTDTGPDFLDKQLIAKKCRSCKEIKSLLDFYRESGTKDGRRGTCKNCQTLRRIDNHKNVLVKESAYRAIHKDRIASINVNYYQRHRDARLAVNKMYQKVYAEAAYLRVKKFRELNPEQARANTARRRIKLKTAMLPQDKLHSTSYRKAIKADSCYYCKCFTDKMQDDHYYPISKGGTDHWWNLVRSCAYCNNSKNDRCGTWMKLKVGAV